MGRHTEPLLVFLKNWTGNVRESVLRLMQFCPRRTTEISCVFLTFPYGIPGVMRLR